MECFSCPQCARQFQLTSATPSQTYLCSNCSSPLEPALAGDSTAELTPVTAPSRPAMIGSYRVRGELGEGGIKNPQVAVLIKKLVSAKVSVYGEVKKPGTFPYESGMTVVQAITLAAGFEKTAQQDAVVIIHASGERLEVPVRAIGLGQVPNVPLMPGDIIYVPESYF